MPNEIRPSLPASQVLPTPDIHKPLLERIDVVNRREGGLIEAFVPISLIYREDVPVDQDHVRELASSILKESQHHQRTGQLSPVLLAQVEGFDQFPIIDGFHRVPALATLGKEDVYATIRPDCTWEDVIDLRIVAATSHKSLKFSRIVEWVNDAWTRSPWADRLNVAGAFQIRFLPASNGARSGILPGEVDAIKQWVDAKCEQWDLSAPYVHRYLQTARLADPELVKSARERKDGRKLEAVTPAHLGAMVKYLPNDYALQQLVAQAATEHVLTVPQTKALSLAVSQAGNLDEAKAIVDGGGWRAIRFESVPIKRTRHKDIDPNNPDAYARVLTDKFFDDQIEIAEILIENAVLTGRFTPQVTEQSARLSTLLITSGVGKENDGLQLDESIEGERYVWGSKQIEELVGRAYALSPTITGHLKRQLRIDEQTAEDIIQQVIEKFYIRVKDGRLPGTYSDPKHLASLLVRMSTLTAIDHIRSTSGRHESSRRTFVSIDEENGSGLSLKDRLGAEDEGIEGITRKNADFIRSLLPFLAVTERRVLILHGYFGLTRFDIAKIIGSTEGSVHQMFQMIKTKTAKLLEKNKVEELG